MSHTPFEDEGRRLHFEEWDRVLDDHLDTVHALDSGVDPMLDWVWDDREYMTLIEVWIRLQRKSVQELMRKTREFLEEFIPRVREAWDNLRETVSSAVDWVADMNERLEEREVSGPPPKPVWVDRSRVKHTRTSPARPVRVFRRVVP